jgi:zinc/manganese transport system substrate-binding protein
MFLLNINRRINKRGARGLNPVKQSLVVATVVVIVLIAAAGIYAAISFTNGPGTTSTSSTTGGVIQVVAAENFWGSLVSQLGGTHVSVTSVVSDPNTDPHQYQSDPSDAKAIANAQLVIINGMDYDTWAGLLINASNTPGQVVLDAQQIVGLSNAEIATVNPHLWYSPWYVNDTVHAMYGALVKMDPADTAYFTANYAGLNSSLYQDYMKAEQQMRAEYGGGSSTIIGAVLRQYSGDVNISATESIVQFLANATGLNILTPVPFMFAVAEGDDPSPADIVTFQQQLALGNQSDRCLVYNIQTVSPVTQQLKTVASQNQVPITDVSETVQPATLTFQAWQEGEVASLQNCLNSVALGN